ncbi:capsular biosynthesis protein [Sphingomonas humi]|uniref:Capsular biosynthesis protein n=1 Tax=Sphingomonas humi TaxID=335630 RepID=A0ABP7S2E8_9SPHN
MMAAKSFLLLQGPPGPLFFRLGQLLESRGHRVTRVNLGGGDRLDWKTGAIDYRGTFSDWPVFVDQLLRDRGVTDILLFGDCRPYHLKAHGIAKLRGVRTHVLEEGYIRPHWMTLELEGVNARSPIRRNKEWIYAQASKLAPEPELPPVTASFKRRARDSYWYYHHVVIGRLRYPHYKSHRKGSIIKEGLGWLWKLANADRHTRHAEATLAKLQDQPLFLFPLQLSGDFQIRSHSPFTDMQGAAKYVVESFAAYAPADAHLLLKKHPLDPSFFNWTGWARDMARANGLEGRLHVIDGGDIDNILDNARGLVCVNSTSATLALARSIPVCAVGEAIYKLPGLTHEGHLDSFWADPRPPEDGLYDAFRRVLLARSLVRGGLASESAVQVLLGSLIERLGA